jgi:26S proteasome regulatory subunit N8
MLPVCLQDIFNLLPNMNVEALSTSLAVKGNDMMAAIYLASLIRSTLALHKLIDNKEQRMWAVSCQALYVVGGGGL